MKQLFTNSSRLASVLGGALILLAFPASVWAAPTPDLTQTINPGTLVTDILDSGRVAVATPAFAMSAKSVSVDCQFAGTASTGLFGSNSQRVYVTNTDAADNGWTLTMAATAGATSTWANTGATQRFDFNDPTGTNAGCDDGADADTAAGQLTVDANAGALTTDCSGCTATGVTKGSAAAYSQGTTDSVTLLNAGSTSDDVWRGYLTGATLSQTVPAATAADSYTINLTVTATAQ